MLYLAYVDEFGHIGPFVSRHHGKYNDSPVFGLGGFIIPFEHVRSFGTFFFKLKCSLLEWEIGQSGKKPFEWEKKGSSLFTTTNVKKYRGVRSAANRILNKINSCEGFVFYNGIEKNKVEDANPKSLYLSALARCLQSLNAFAASRDSKIIIVMDEHQDREIILNAASQAMYRPGFPRRNIVEPPFQVESHRYQTCQCADWICGLIGRMGAYQVRPEEYADLDWTETYFRQRIESVAWRSGIRMERDRPDVDVGDIEEVAAVIDTPQED